MFGPTERYNLADLLRPPSRYRLHCAVGTTYSLEFVSLTALLLAFVDAEPEGEESGNEVDLLRAITRLSKRLAIFADRGSVRTYPHATTNKVCALFDGLVQEAANDEGCFHPKVWVVRYEPRVVADNPSLPTIVRLICSSRNLTSASQWEAFVAIDGRVSTKRSTCKLASQTRAFLNYLKGPKLTEPMATLMTTLERTEFERAKESRDFMELLWQEPNRKLMQELPASGQRALVVSPFVRKTFLTAILDHFSWVTLISTQRELDQIQDDHFHARLAKHEVYVMRDIPGDVDQSTLDLHAKIYIFEGDFGTRTLVGSANASESGWKGHNCEAMIAFSPGIRVERFGKEFLLDEESNLRGWIEKYRRQPCQETDQDKADKEVDKLRRALSRMSVRADFCSSAKTLTLAVDNADDVREILNNQADLQVSVCPLSIFSSPGVALPINELFTSGLIFGLFSVVDLSKFIVFAITHARLSTASCVVLKAETNYDHLLDQRTAGVLQQLLTREKFQEFLRAILYDSVRRADRTSDKHRGANTPNGSFLSGVSLEDVLQSCTEDRTRVEEIDSLLKTFAGTDFIDPDFASFWTSFRSVLLAVGGELSNG